MAGTEVRVRFFGDYSRVGCSGVYREEWVLRKEGNGFTLRGNGLEESVLLPLAFRGREPEAFFELANVTIGVDFHWERQENQRFKGALRCIEEDDKIRVINDIDIEEYLLSVISSEMSATSSIELLKAHAVISRSWLIAQCEKARHIRKEKGRYQSTYQTDNEYIRWFDREDHVNFDVCADDHCQRYQGIQRETTSTVREALVATRGEVLLCDGEVCDARFSKCCGGITEDFERVWEPSPRPYLKSVYDGDAGELDCDMSGEGAAARWIADKPDVFCHTTDKKILSEVLNDYDQSTVDFFRWKVEYTEEELSNLVRRKLDMDFGTITDLVSVERGRSGRLVRLKIVGTKRTLTIGKELMIRKALSPTHLYSSAFTVEKTTLDDGTGIFRLHGAGWGHGVGLCQIGAAVMSAKGYGYKEILRHYFPNTTIGVRS